MVDLEGDEGVCRVDGVAGRFGLGQSGDEGCGCGQGDEGSAHGRAPGGWGLKRGKRGRRRCSELATPVSASLNVTCTSSATMEVSAHSPSPILKARRLSGRLPVAVVVPPDCVSTTGTVTSTDVPLMVSCRQRRTCRRPGP